MSKDKNWALEELEALYKKYEKNDSASYAFNIAINIIKELDDQEKPIVPQHVADFLAEYEGESLEMLFDVLKYSHDPEELTTAGWVDAYPKEFARAWLDGYEVEKEKMYEVIIDTGISSPEPTIIVLYESIGGDVLLREITKQRYLNSKENQISSYWVTEKQIKKHNEKLWAFAVEVAE